MAGKFLIKVPGAEYFLTPKGQRSIKVNSKGNLRMDFTFSSRILGKGRLSEELFEAKRSMFKIKGQAWTCVDIRGKTRPLLFSSIGTV